MNKIIVSCWQCDGGYVGHDCGEDVCCCLNPEDNERCDICNGEGAYIMDSDALDPEDAHRFIAFVPSEEGS